MEKLLRFNGEYKIQVTRKGHVVKRLTKKNGIVNAGLIDILDVYFNGGTQATVWYCGLIDSAGYTGIGSGDTMSSHSGWVELQDYSESVRQTWSPVYIGDETYLNTTACTFTIDDDVDLRGMFIANDSTKGGTSGTLWSTATISELELLTGDTVTVQYQVTASR
jgi:hypothetical protein